ncbi:MAG TPA: hypothetical protein PLZ62_04265 [bacterium]|nr:hypothetical protein [bacterium]
MKWSWSKIMDWCLDWVMPRYCLGCGLEGGCCCRRCFEMSVKWREQQICPICRHVNNTGKICTECHQDWNLDGLVVAAEKNKFVLKMIAEYKYNDVIELEKVLAKILYQVVAQLKSDVGLWCGVPLAPKRFYWRGFNQSERLAKLVTGKIGIKYDDLLRRKKFVKQQVGLKKEERMENVKNVFEIKKLVENSLPGKKVWIVDDVATTLATLNECAKVLKESGAAEVMGVVLVRE